MAEHPILVFNFSKEYSIEFISESRFSSGTFDVSFYLQFVNDLHGLISPTPQGTPLPLVLLGKV